VNVPAVLNVWLYDWPTARVPLSNTPATSEVAVWGVVPAELFVQVTVSPTVMFSVAGVNWKFVIETVEVAALAVAPRNMAPEIPTITASTTATAPSAALLVARIGTNPPLVALSGAHATLRESNGPRSLIGHALRELIWK
jgi:hypothetical protein